MDVLEEVIKNKEKKMGITITKAYKNKVEHVYIKVEGYFRKWSYLQEKLKSFCNKNIELVACNIDTLQKLKYFNFWCNQAKYLLNSNTPYFVHLDFSNLSNKKIATSSLNNFYMVKSLRFGKKLKSVEAGVFCNLQNCQAVYFPKKLKLSTASFLLLGNSYDNVLVKNNYGNFKFEVFNKLDNTTITKGTKAELKTYLSAHKNEDTHNYYL